MHMYGIANYICQLRILLTNLCINLTDSLIAPSKSRLMFSLKTGHYYL